MKKNRELKVLFVIPQLSGGGSEQVVLDLSRNLGEFDFEPSVAYFDHGNAANRKHPTGPGMFHLRKKPGFDPSVMLMLAQIVRKQKIDVVNAHHYMPFFYCFGATKLMNRRRLVYTEHSVPEVEKVASSLHGKLFKGMLYQVDAAVGVSREIAQSFRDRYPRHAPKIHAIPNGVDLDRFAVAADRGRTRASWGLAGEHYVVGMVANFRKVKNHCCLLRAAARLKEARPELRLVLVGTGFPGHPEDTEGEVRWLIGELDLRDRVVLAGYQENIPKILGGFDVFCLPSLSEGLPVSVLEAMAAGVPVIGSAVRGIRETVTHEQTGLLFPPDDDAALAQHLERLAADERYARMLADRALAYVSAHHGKRDWMSRYAQVLRGHR